MVSHLLGLDGLSRGSIVRLLLSARDMSRRVIPLGAGPLAGRIVANLFFEDSTRTRTSFSVAAKRLSAEVVDLIGASSSVSKGETLIDTARNVEAMGVGAVVVRARQSGAAALIARHCECPVINAGDGRHEHPTQGLLDIYTLAEAHGRLGDFALEGLSIAIVGDVVSSRVARSAIAGMTTLGARVICVGPPPMAPGSLKALGCEVTHDLDEVIGAVDAVMMLRIQFERHGEGAKPAPGAEAPKQSAIASVREFRTFYALTAEREGKMRPGAVVMHPGPINRGIELDAAVADGPRSVILRQVSNGVLVRMAVLEQLMLAPEPAI